jgi:hypothetical protein
MGLPGTANNCINPKIMLIKELFTLNPEQVNLKNEGVAKVRTINETDDIAIVEHELRTFVCEGEYHDGLFKILYDYLANFGHSDRPAFWVSGFYGSGKSHLVKMLSYLWENFQFPGGQTARAIKPLPIDIQELFVELDRKQKLHGHLTISGTLRDFPSQDIYYSFLQLLLHSLGLPKQYHHFKFIHWLKQENAYEEVKALVESKGKDFFKEVENLFVSSTLSKSILEILPEFAENEIKAKELFRAQFPRVDNIGRHDLIRTMKEEIFPMIFGEKIPCTLVVLDEVQQFIGQDNDRATSMQFLAEDLCSHFDSKLVLVATGQNALTDTTFLQKLMARFRIPIQLTDIDIQKVIRKTILEKKPSVVTGIDKKMEDSLGEISRNLEGTLFGYITDDRQTLVADYPLLPSTRKFWNKLLQMIDTAGTSGQLRNQLRLVDESLKAVARAPLGCVVPADSIFNQNQTQLIQSGRLLNDTNNLIQERKAKGGEAELEGRILSVVFLLQQITSIIPDSGLKSKENTIADLLIENLNENSDAFRNKIKVLIKKLVDEKVLMAVNDEFKLQTKVGQEWEQEYLKQHIKLNSSGDDQIQNHRREKIVGYLKEKTKGISVSQGYSKMQRNFDLWDKDTEPNTDFNLNLWIRDGWFENEKLVLDEIRAAGSNSPLAYIFVKKHRDTELRTEVVRYLAAGLTINAMGLPSTPEAEQAKKGMETRQSQAKTAIQELIEKICDEATVYLAGGTVIQSGTLKENMSEALNNIADRQFPDFKGKADSMGWGQALSKALAGNPDALSAVSYKGDVDKHPVAIEILRFIGNSTKQGKEIRNHFMKAPYGWSQDAIDTLLVMLKNAQWISTTEPDLKVGKINQATFKKELHTLSVKDKIGIRKLLQDAGISCPPNQDIFPYSNQYLNKLKELAGNVSGDAPRPEPFNTNSIKEIENKEGNERLLDILQQKDELKIKLEDWTTKSQLVAQREPLWELLAQLNFHLPDHPEFESLKAEIDAIRDNRLLLQEPDPVQPKLNEITEKLGQILNRKKTSYNSFYDAKMASLQHNIYFEKLTPEQKHSILVKHQLLAKPEIKSTDARGLLNQLNKASLDNWDTKIAALDSQFQAALEDAVKLSAPQAKSYSLPRKTLTSQAEIDAYLTELKAELENLLKESSSIILK